MTTRGESDADPQRVAAEEPAAPTTEARPAHTRAHAAPAAPRLRLRSRTAALIGLLIVSASVATWAEVHYTGTSTTAAGVDVSGTSQDSLGAPVADDPSGTAAAQDVLPDPATIAPVTVDVPVSATNPTAYQETRYALGSATSCADVLAPTVPDAVVTSCQGYLAADYLSGDHAVVSQVTLLTFADAAAARRAQTALNGDASVLMRQPGSAAPGVTAPPTPAQWKVAQVGRFVTVVHSAYATQTTPSTTAPAAPADLVTPTWFLSAQTADAVVWDG
jgi:hypothetical protein